MAKYSKHHQNRVLFNLALVAFLAVGAVIGLNLITNPKALGLAGAWDCSKYTFNVTSTGDVTVLNSSSKSESSQTADVYINNAKVSTVNIPALAAYGVTPTKVGTVSVPSSGVFSWRVDGSKDCENTGNYTAPCDYVEIKVQ